ncbi:MAG: alpha-amylase, partial [Betaproteobacteria bacterium]|nr:alpha-amylase [Betaproteobacteria bacterium]
EPARSLEERRAKHSPLRDVAGMLRSFSYARWTALRDAAQVGGDAGALGPLAAAWEVEVRSAFLAAYEHAMRGGEFWSDFGEMRALLELFELEKALYELRYELRTRPAWARVPLAGILGAAGLD